MIRYRGQALIVLATILTFATVSGGARLYAAVSPLDTTRSFVDQALKIMADKQVPVDQRAHQLRAVIEPHFDFTAMARQSLGRHWLKLNAQQRQDFAATFKSFMESAYLDKIGDYSGQQVAFTDQTSLGSGYSEVHSNIVQPGKQSIPVNYLLEQKGGGWLVYDVTVDNISIIQNYQNQFNRVINSKGFDQLLADLKAKQRQLNEPGAGGGYLPFDNSRISMTSTHRRDMIPIRII
jgi:phospholipid transport system substrate-binding protein